MGLDMYLNKKIFIGANYDHRNITGDIRLRENGKKIKIDVSRVSEITERIGYWRKANQIHNWFVENVQEGDDNCATYYVSRENLQKLLDSVNLVLGEPSFAKTELPPQKGFFFGSTDFDNYYFEDLKYTKELLEGILSEENEGYGEFSYQSSW